MKTCRKCGSLKNESEFAWKEVGKRLQSYCKDCQKVYRREHYEANKQKYIDKASKWRVEQREEFYGWLNKQSCVDCGNSDMRVLEFDHLRDKEFTISKVLGTVKFDVLKKEMDKCDVVCANCHRIRTATRGNHYQYASIV